MRRLIPSWIVIVIGCACLLASQVAADNEWCWTPQSYVLPEDIWLTFYSEPVGTIDVADESEFPLIQAGIATWDAALWTLGQPATLRYEGHQIHSSPPFPPVNYDYNWVFWYDNADTWSLYYGDAVAVAVDWEYDGYLYAGDIVLDEAYYVPWGGGDPNLTLDVQSFVAHEVGHFVGLGNLKPPEFSCDDCCWQIMWYQLGPMLQKRELGVGDWTGLEQIYPDATPVEDFTAIGEELSIRLEWHDSCIDTCHYDVQRATRPTGPYVTIDSIERIGTGSFEYVDDSVDWGRIYCYRLDGEQACGIPLYLPEPDTLLAPSDLTARDVVGDCGGAILIEWSPSESEFVDGYHVYRCTSGMPGSEVYTGSAEESPFIDSTASVGVEYSYVAVAYNDGDELSKDSNHSECSSTRDLPVEVSVMNSSAQMEMVDGASLCPLGDLGQLEISVQVRDQCGWPVWDMPADSVFAVAASPPGGPISCFGDTIYASAPTNGSGRTTIDIPRIGGCGDIAFDVYAGGVLLDQSMVFVTSPDMNGDCFVDFADFMLFSEYYASSDPCADLDGSGDVGLADQVIFLQHYGDDMYHFCVDPQLSQFTLDLSDPECFVLCPKGDIESLAGNVTARNSLNGVFEYSSIPADSVRVMVPPPNFPGINASFRFVCRSQKDRAIADHDTDANEQTTVTANAGGGHSENMPMKTVLGGWVVDAWRGTAKSPDIDATGQVGSSDMSIFGSDYGTTQFRSDLDCSGQVGDSDFDVLNVHYKHKCGASSQMLAEGYVDHSSWSEQDVTTIRSHISNEVLDRWLGKQLHPELRALLEEARSLDEPESFTREGGSIESSEMSMLPQVTAMAQNVPNPFRVTAAINYQVAPPGGKVTIFIFDVAGRRVRTLVDKDVPPGFYAVRWDGKDDSGRRVASGVYFYEMKAPGYSSAKRLILLR